MPRHISITDSHYTQGATFPGWGSSNAVTVPDRLLMRIIQGWVRMPSNIAEKFVEVNIEISPGSGTYTTTRIGRQPGSTGGTIDHGYGFPVPSGHRYYFTRDSNDNGSVEQYNFTDFGEDPA